MFEARTHGNEAAAIGALKTLGTSQSLFREGDKEDDDVLDYGTMQELVDQGLIDEVLGSGTKNGYFFEVRVHKTAPEFQWMAVANPAVPGTTGERYFVTNHEGVTYYSNETPFTLNDQAAIPKDATPVGK